MTKLKALNNELQELYQFESRIIRRLWDNSEVAEGSEGSLLFPLPKIPLTKENIEKKVAELAQRIKEEFQDTNLIIVGLMDGATPFANLLTAALKQLNYDFNYCTMSVSSYGNELVSGSLKIGSLPKLELIGRSVLIIDDVCETGKSLKAVRDTFLEQFPIEVKTMTLVNKSQVRPEGINPDYVGFEVSKDDFIIGMGLDWRKGLRNEDSIKAANKAFLPSPEEQARLNRIKIVQNEIRALKAAQAPAAGQNSFFFQATEEFTPEPAPAPAPGL